MRNILLFPLLLLSLVLASCAGVDDGGNRRRDRDEGPPTFSIRADREAERIVSAAEDFMQRAGYEPARGRWADFELELKLDAGPVNAIVNMNLTRHGRTVAAAEGHEGGPRMLFDRSGVIQDAFDDCANKLERDLPRADGRRW